MEHALETTTVQMDDTGFDQLTNQILNGKSNDSNPEDIRVKPEKNQSSGKKYIFKKGDQSFELDEDFEVEMMADKKPVKLTIRDLKDRAAGDIAVKNRMHSLAEEKKRVQATFKEFAVLAQKDPLGALEYISSKAKEADTSFEYNNYLEKLAEQAEKLGKMDEKDRKAWELEKKLEKAEQDLSQKSRAEAVVLRKQEILTEYPEIGDSEFGQMVDTVLNSDELSEGLETEHDVMNKVEELIQEVLTQRDIVSVIKEINPQHMNDEKLIFSLSDQLRQNPDLDEEDVRDIIRELVGPEERVKASPERIRDSRILSSKQRQSGNYQKTMTPYESLASQLLENKEKINKTPIQLR